MFDVLRVVSCERGAHFHLQAVLDSVTRWHVSMDIPSTVVREKSTENDECVAPLSYFYGT
jgi:hypothetical protein